MGRAVEISTRLPKSELPLTLSPPALKTRTNAEQRDRRSMSRGGGAEGMARLRRAVGEIEARSGPAETRAPGVGLSLPRARDRALGGGLSGDALHEIVPATPGDGAAAMGFALALAARFMAEHSAAGLLLAEDFAGCGAGAVYGPGLVAYGLELGRLVFVRAPDAPALFQAMEEALKSGAPAVVVGEV